MNPMTRLGFAPVLLLLLTSATPAKEPAITGFRADDVPGELAHEAEAAAIPRPDSLRRHLRILTAVPHVAGTPADRATAEYVRDRMVAYGWETRIEEIPVWLNYPVEVGLEMTAPHRETLSLRETGLEWDRTAYNHDALPAFHGYGAAGEVEADVVYANYGDVDDFKKLAEMGVELRGRVVLVRYGKNFRGLKVRNAERAGAAAVLIYSDPADDGYAVADPYPRGPARPADAIQRGSVQFLGEAPGDPTTPGWPSKAGGKRLSAAEAHGIPRIPSLPIAYSEGQKLLAALEGPNAPKGWQGGLPLAYHVGPGPARVHLKSVQDYKVRPIWNVIATLRGREAPDQWVVGGNHRDAWTFGAVDPNSGTICMLEMGRALGQLVKSGWTPRRSIVLCSWDGEEYGLLGSTEWAETHADELEKKAVTYINVDAAAGGRDFSAGGSHALRDLVVEAAGEVHDAGRSTSLFKAWNERATSDGKADWARLNRERRWRGEPERPFEVNLGTLGSGSDYTAFVDHLGIASLNLGMNGVNGTYHSMYDDFDYMDRVVDPGFLTSMEVTEIWTRITMRLADAEVLPMRYSATGQFALDELRALADRMEDASAGVSADSAKMTADLKPLVTAATRLRDAGRAIEGRVDAALAGGNAAEVGALNAALMQAERAMLGAGLPGRPWFRHELYAPGLNTGYAAVALPRVGQAMLDRDPKALRAGIEPLREALDRAAAVLERAGSPPPTTSR